MERIADNADLELLRPANICLQQFLARYSGLPVVGNGEEVEALLQVERTLQSVGALLDGRLQSSKNPETCTQLARYRANLIRLHQELAALQNSAAECQARLLSRQKHLQAARAWCAASRDTT